MSIYFNDEESKQMKDMIIIIQSEVDKLNQEIKRLREALKVYADHNNWILDKSMGVDLRIFREQLDKSIVNGWELAQKALEQTNLPILCSLLELLEKETK